MWWSDFETANQLKQLHESCGVTHRLNCAAEVVHKFSEVDGDARLPVETIHVPMEDKFDDDDDVKEVWREQMEQGLEILRRLRDEGAVVNINCQMGKNRSGCMVLLWLCSECGWKLHEAAEHIRVVTAIAVANPYMLLVVNRILGVNEVLPLNEAGEQGGWIMISPPGSPRLGGTAAVEATAQQAMSMVGSEYSRDTSAKATKDRTEDEVEMNAVPLFEDLSDVD